MTPYEEVFWAYMSLLYRPPLSLSDYATWVPVLQNQGRMAMYTQISNSPEFHNTMDSRRKAAGLPPIFS